MFSSSRVGTAGTKGAPPVTTGAGTVYEVSDESVEEKPGAIFTERPGAGTMGTDTVVVPVLPTSAGPNVALRSRSIVWPTGAQSGT
jgi:hypothetical protein